MKLSQRKLFIARFEEFAEENRLGDFMIRNTPQQDAAHSFPWPSVSGFRASVPGTEKVPCCTPPSRSHPPCRNAVTFACVVTPEGFHLHSPTCGRRHDAGYVGLPGPAHDNPGGVASGRRNPNETPPGFMDFYASLPPM